MLQKKCTVLSLKARCQTRTEKWFLASAFCYVTFYRWQAAFLRWKHPTQTCCFLIHSHPASDWFMLLYYSHSTLNRFQEVQSVTNHRLHSAQWRVWVKMETLSRTHTTHTTLTNRVFSCYESEVWVFQLVRFFFSLHILPAGHQQV